MRVTWAALPLAVATLGLAACGDDKDDKGTSRSTGASPYPEQVQENFLRACKASGGDDEKCGCALDKLEETVSYADFKRADAEIRGGKKASGKTADDIAAAVKSCT